MSEKIGLIDVGGGMRDIYGTGVLDFCLDNDIKFDCCIGISAGAGNIASYIAGQHSRSRRYYEIYSARRKYMSLWNFITTGSYIGMDYVYGYLPSSKGEDPWDYEAAKNHGAEFIIVASNALTGEPEYFTMDDLELDDYTPMKCSACIPVVCKPIMFRGIPYYDGAITAPIPIEKAFEHGCDKVVVILTRPVDFRKSQGSIAKFYKSVAKKYPEFGKKLYERHTLYNDSLENILNNYVPNGKAVVIAPDDCCGIDTLVHDSEKMSRLYHKGYDDGIKIKSFLDL